MQEIKYKTDVVIIGGGLAGIATAIDLLDRKKQVLILDRDRQENFGGLAKESFGGIFMVDTPVQRRMGIKDNSTTALNDWFSYAQFSETDIWPKKWAQQYVNQSFEDIYLWLERHSVRFFPVVHWVERGYDVMGNSVPRFHMVWGTGKWLITALIRHLTNHKNKDLLTLRFEHFVQDIEFNQGKAVGCVGVDEKNLQSFSVQASTVVAASGGICGNLSRVRENWYAPWGKPPDRLLNGSHKYALGNVHDIVTKHGGNVTHTDKMWNYAAGVNHPKPRMPLHGLSLVPPRSALWLNYEGRRIGPPHLVAGFDTRYLLEQICREPYQYSWQVMNKRIAIKELAVSGSEYNDAISNKNLLAFLKDILLGNKRMVDELIATCPDIVTSESVYELAEKMNALEKNSRLNPNLLASEINKYDTLIEKRQYDSDDQLRRIVQLRNYRGDRVRTCFNQKIYDPKAFPLIAIRLFPLTRKSLGGVQTDLSSRVLSKSGEPIPNLYAVGETAGFGGGGIHGLRTLEGTLLGSCILTGRMAARSIAG